MSHIPPEELSREIGRLWSRLGSVSTSPIEPPVEPPKFGGAELAWETVDMLKTQQRRREAAFNEAIQAKEESLKHWRARAEALHAENEQLRQKAEGGDQRVLSEILDAQARLQTAVHALDAERAAHEEERKRLQAALDEARAAVSAEITRAQEAEARWAKREAQHAQDLKDMQQTAQRRQNESAAADESVRALKNGLAEAKNALEKTLAELLLERREKARVESERERALKKTDEVERHFEELQNLWDEERAQWRELWDREHSTWETQRQDLAQWEETLRREREAWHAELQNKEKAHLAFTDSLAGKIRETTAAAETVAERMKQIETREMTEQQRHAAADARQAQMKEEIQQKRKRRRWQLALAALVLAAAAGVVPGWRWAMEWVYTSEAAAPVAFDRPAALAYDGGLLWVADWSGRLSALDPADPRRVARSAAPAVGLYRPTGLAFGRGWLWSLDASRARLLKHSAASPEVVVSSRASAGPAPTCLAFDGSTLWSYDAADHAVYRHGDDDAPGKAYAVSDSIVPNAMAWINGRLWLHDTKTRRLLVYAMENEELALKESHPAPDPAILGFTVIDNGGERRIWALSGVSAERAVPALLRFKMKRRIPFAKF